MHARTGKPQQHMAGRHLLARHLLAAFDRTHAEARQIIVARRVHARHFGGFATDQRAARLPASFRDACDHPLSDRIVELSGGEIIQKEQGFGTLYDQIVDAHRDQVDAHAVMPVMLDRQLQFGAHAVIGRDQQRIGIAGGLRIEKSAKAADFAIGARPACRLDQRTDCLDEGVAGIDRDTGLGIGVGGGVGAHAARL